MADIALLLGVNMFHSPGTPDLEKGVISNP